MTSNSRRNFVRRGVYVAPAILTFAATPQFAKAGSVKTVAPPAQDKDKDKHKNHDERVRGREVVVSDRNPFRRDRRD